MAALSAALIARDVPRLPAHATVGEALATLHVAPGDVAAVVDGDLFIGLVRGRALHHHVRHSPDERTSLAHVCELLARLLGEGADAAAIIEDDHLVDVVFLDGLRQPAAR